MNNDVIILCDEHMKNDNKSNLIKLNLKIT